MPISLQTGPSVKTISRRCTVAGFTLVELVVTIAVMAIALLGVAYSLQFSAQHAADPLWQTKTVALVQAYSDEIFTKRYDELTPVGGVPACNPCTLAAKLGADDAEVRDGGVNSFDDVDDYHGLDEQPRDAQGALRPAYAGYRMMVTVTYAGAALGLARDESAKQITLTVTPPGQQPLPFSVYRSNF